MALKDMIMKILFQVSDHKYRYVWCFLSLVWIMIFVTKVYNILLYDKFWHYSEFTLLVILMTMCLMITIKSFWMKRGG